MKVLFLCTGNSCRSQMAEVLLRRLRPAWEVHSAGVEAHGLNPRMLQAMEETGPLPGDLHSKTVAELEASGHPLASFETVITLCGDAQDRCPKLPSTTRHEHWDFPDPARASGTREEIHAQFCAVRNNLESRLRQWLKLYA